MPSVTVICHMDRAAQCLVSELVWKPIKSSEIYGRKMTSVQMYNCSPHNVSGKPMKNVHQYVYHHQKSNNEKSVVVGFCTRYF